HVGNAQLSHLYKTLEQNNRQATSILMEMPEAQEDRIFQKHVANIIPETSSPTGAAWEVFFDRLTDLNPIKNISVKCVDLRGCIFSLQAVKEQEEAYLSGQIDQYYQMATCNRTLRDAYNACKKTYELAQRLTNPDFFKDSNDYYKIFSPELYKYKDYLNFDDALQQVLFNNGIESEVFGHSQAYLYSIFNGPLVTDGFDIPALYEITKEDAEKKVIVIAGTAHCGAIQNYLIETGYKIIRQTARFKKSADEDRREATRLFNKKTQVNSEELNDILAKILSKSLPITKQDLELIDDEKLEEFLAANSRIS
ncbi:hypothetical protein KAT92_02540, partial [Candidatus Babeliales bacterium]|nr:hypothetical protein [Candidatus Babeliales bacterium]